MATSAPISGMNPAYIADPSLYADQLGAQQQQALAQALIQEGLTPSGGTQMAGNVAIRNGPLQGLAKIAQILSGQDMQQSANQTQAALMARQNAAMASMFGVGQQQQPQGLSPASASMAAGAQNGSVGPTVQNAQTMQSMPPPQQSAAPSGVLGLPGMNPMQAYASYAMNPDKYMDAYDKGYTPNDTTIAARQAGVDPMVANRLALLKSSTDPKILAMQQAGMSTGQIYAAVFGEAAKNAEIDRKQGNEFYNPMLNQSGMVPKLPDGANPTGPPNAYGAIPGVSSVPGSTGVIGANQAARSANEILSGVQQSDGSSVPMWAGSAAGGGRAPVPAGVPPPVAAPSGVMPPSVAAPAGAMPAPSASPAVRTIGQSTSNAAIQKSTADAIANAPQTGAQAASSITGLQNALNIVESGLKTGQGTAGPMNLAAVMGNLDVNFDGSKSSAENYQSLKKYLQNSLNTAAAGTGASGSDARFESFSQGQPDATTMTGKPLAGAIRYVLSQQDAAAARSAFLPKAYAQAAQAGDPNAALTAQAQWTQAYKPQFFNFNRMSPDDQAAYIKAQGPNARAFVQGYNQYAQQTGWVK